VFRHCVMFKWADDVSADAKAAVSAGLDELAKLTCVQGYQHGPDAGVSDGNWDYVAVGDFASVDDYKTYATDEGHLTLIADLIKPNISARAAIQYDC
jgi:hypothetical protein